MMRGVLIHLDDGAVLGTLPGQWRFKRKWDVKVGDRIMMCVGRHEHWHSPEALVLKSILAIPPTFGRPCSEKSVTFTKNVLNPLNFEIYLTQSRPICALVPQ